MFKADKKTFQKKLAHLEKLEAKAAAKKADKGARKRADAARKDAEKYGEKLVVKQLLTPSEFSLAFARRIRPSSEFVASTSSVPAPGAKEPVVDQAQLIESEESGSGAGSMLLAAGAVIAAVLGARAYFG